MVELLLNLCWLALVLPAFLLWRRRSSSDRTVRRSFLFLCALGCVLILLFPIISASDDLHSSGLAIEESKRTVCHGGHCTFSPYGPLAHPTQLAIVAMGIPPLRWARAGMVLPFSQSSSEAIAPVRKTGRAPPALRTFSA